MTESLLAFAGGVFIAAGTTAMFGVQPTGSLILAGLALFGAAISMAIEKYKEN